MPDGRTHLAMTVGATGLMAATAWFAGTPPEYVVAVSLGGLAGAVISPDLDVDGGCIAFYVVKWMFGTPAAKVWRWFWYPYARWVPHRSWVSHSLPGTFIRLAYLLALPVLLMLVMGIAFPTPQWSWAWFLGGLLVSDGLHIAADNYTSRTKRGHRARIRKFGTPDVQAPGQYRENA